MGQRCDLSSLLGICKRYTKIGESKRFYALFGLGANVAMLFSGPAIIYFSNIRSKLPADVDAWGVTLNYMVGMVVLSGLIIMGIYWWINKNVLTDTRFYDPAEMTARQERKTQDVPQRKLYVSWPGLNTSFAWRSS